jgi:hypothetical protein
VPAAVAMAALLLIDIQPQQRAPRAEAVADAASEGRPRLVVFWIDSLAWEDMQDDRVLPRLKARIAEGGLHGPTRACADAMSEPCLTAMATGVDRFSLFMLAKKLAASGAVAKGSVFHLLRREGFRLGFIGDFRMEPVVGALDWVELRHDDDDSIHIANGMAALTRERLDFLLIQLHHADEVAHRHRADSQQYRDALNASDREIDEAIRAHLGPDDHFAILGDHGHMLDGRHFAGLDVPSYLAYFGPLFRRSHHQGTLMTDHARLWARVFGFRFGEAEWLRRYFAGEPLAASREPPPPPSVWRGLPWTTFGAVLLLAFGLVLAWPWTRLRERIGRVGRLAGFGFAASVVMFVVSAHFDWLRPRIYGHSDLFNAALVSVGGLVGVGLMSALRPVAGPLRDWLAPAFGIGTLLISLPTIYKFGSIYAAMTGLAVVLGGAALFEAARHRQWRTLIGAALWIGLLQTVQHPRLSNYKIDVFGLYASLGDAQRGVCALLVGVMAWLASVEHARRTWLLAAGLGFVALLVGPWLPAWVFLVPCVASFPFVLLALRRPQLAPWAFAAALPALGYFFGFSAQTLCPVFASMALWPLWAHARGRDASPLEAGFAIVTLTAVTMWTSFGARIAGIDFGYFFEWLPATAQVEDTQYWNALLTLCKYLLVPALGWLCAVHARGGELFVRGAQAARDLTSLKLGVVLIGLVAFMRWSASDLGVFVIADAYQDAALWVLISLFLAMLGDRVARVGTPPVQASGH